MKQKSLRQFLLIGALLFLASTLQAQSKTSIAVLPLSSNGISPSEALVLTDELLSVLVQSDVYTVVERSNMESILKEQGFQMSGCTSSECAVEAGKLLGVQKMIAGSIGKLGAIYNINLRLFDVETGEIEQNISQKHKGSIEELLDITAELGKKLSDGVVIAETGDPSISASKQTTPFPRSRIGIWIGANFPKTSTISNVNGGITGGLFYKAQLSGTLYLQPEISYAGSEIELYEPDDILNIEYLQLAALFAYETSRANSSTFLNLSVGPALNLILSATNDYEGYVSDVKSKLNSSGLVGVVGVGLGLNAGSVIITLDGRYEFGFDTILEDDTEWQVGELQAFYVLLGISF